MKRRTKEFAKEIISLCRELPNDREERLIGGQIFRSGTSIAANFDLLVGPDLKRSLFQN